METNAIAAILERRICRIQAEMARNAGSDAVKVSDMDQSKRDGGPITRARRSGKWLELWFGAEGGEFPNFSCKPDELDYAIESRGLSDFARDHGLFSLSLTLAPNATGYRVITGVSAIVPREMVTCAAGIETAHSSTRPPLVPTLRDEFAMAVVPALYASSLPSGTDPSVSVFDTVAKCAYIAADAMLKAREPKSSTAVDDPDGTARSEAEAAEVARSIRPPHRGCDSIDEMHAEMHRVAGTSPVVGCHCDSCEKKRTDAVPEKYRVPKHQHRFSLHTKRCIYCDVPEFDEQRKPL